MNSSVLAVLLLLGLLPAIMIPVRTIQIAKGSLTKGAISEGPINRAILLYLLLIPGWFLIGKIGFQLFAAGCSGEACTFTLIWLVPVALLYLVSEALIYIGKRGI
ncbi:MAG TPA: hypothetical protein VF050_12540 [Moraxellaceae bacterium]